jgi:hypothetical protein
MKSFINYIWSVMDSFGRARAATYFARLGDYEAAKRVMAE